MSLLSIPVQRVQLVYRASHVLQLLPFPTFVLCHPHLLLPDGANLGVDRLEVLVERRVTAGYDVVLLGDMEMQIRNMVGWREEDDVAHGDEEESLVILDDDPTRHRASHAGRRIGLLRSTNVGRERRLM